MPLRTSLNLQFDTKCTITYRIKTIKDKLASARFMDNYKLSGVPERQYNCRSAGSIARPEGAAYFNPQQRFGQIDTKSICAL